MVETQGLFILQALLLTSTLWLPLVIMSFLSQKMMAMIGRKAVLIIGLIGIPIHEASHLIACVLFNHKVIDMALYKPSLDGTLGYVSYQYKPSWISPFACLFIGIAPLFGGWVAFLGLTYGIRPDLYHVIIMNIGAIESLQSALHFLYEFVALILNGPFIKTFLWVICSFSILLFCIPSRADFSGCKKAIFYVLGIFIVWTFLDAEKAMSTLTSISPVLTLIAAPMYLGIILLVILFFIFRGKQISSNKLLND